MAEQTPPPAASPLPPKPKGQFPPKQLNTTSFHSDRPEIRKKAWDDVSEFLHSIREKLFAHEEIPASTSERNIDVPDLVFPGGSIPAGKIIFGLEEEWGSGLHNDFLYIEDVGYLTYQIWQQLQEEKPLLEKKKRALLKNSQQDLERAEAWQKRLDKVTELELELDTDIKPLRSQFNIPGFENGFDNGLKQINYEKSEKLLEWRFEQSHGGEFRNGLDALITYVDKLKVEAGFDLAEIEDGKIEPAIEETPGEKTEEPPDISVLLPDTETTPDSGDNTGGSDLDQPTETQPQRPTPPQRSTEPDEPQTLQDIELNNLKTITIETERLSRIFLYQLAAEYGLPPELLQADNSGFRDTIREDMRQWIVKKLQAGELDALYDPNAIRERQLLVARFGEVLTRDGRFDLFQKILIKHHGQLNTNPDQQKAFKEQLQKGSFQDATTWKSLLDNFANGLLDDDSDPERATAVNPRDYIASALRNSIQGLAYDINDLGIADLNYADNPEIFGERLTQITTMIDVMVALRFAPIYLETIGREHFRETFKLNVSEGEYQALITVLQAYWDVRERSFTEKGINLNYVLEGLDADELEDWIENMAASSKEEYYNRYLERLEYFAEVGRRVGGFHRVVLNMAPRGTVAATEDDAGELDPTGLSDEDIKKQSAVTKLKLEIMRDGLAYAFSQLPDDAKRAVYNNIDPSQTDEWIKTSYFPVEITFNDLDLIAQYANEMGITSPVAPDDILNAGGHPYDPAVGPMAGTAHKAVQGIRTTGNRIRQARAYFVKRQKKIAKQAAKKTAQATTKATAEVALNALGSALGLPGLGTVLVNLWYSIPEQFRPIIAFLLVTGPLALLGGVVGWLFGLPSWLSGLGAKLSSWFKGLFDSKAVAVTTPTPYAGGAFNSGTAAAQATAQATAGTAAKVVMGIHPSAQAILISTGVMTVSSLINYMVVTNAFLANFPLPDEDKSINEKISKYVALEKNVTVPAPCDQTTLKCPELNGGDTYDVTYTIKLTLKGDYTVSINKIKDEITAKFSKKKFEELHRPLPANIVITKEVIPATEPGSRSDFEELTTDPNDERNILRPGEELILTYVETYDSSFNNSQVRNIFHAEFFYVDGDQTGNDFVETSKAICIGDCSQEEGCWPATGRVSQEPWGSFSHSSVDAYDIADPHGSSSSEQELKKHGVPIEQVANPTKIYSPFEAQACYPPFSSVYGNYVVLTTKDWVYWQGHMVSRAQESGCQQVSPGDIVGVMGTTGSSTGVHLHWELRTHDGSTAVGKPADPLGDQMPPSLTGKMNPKENDYVGSCYDMD